MLIKKLTSIIEIFAGVGPSQVLQGSNPCKY